MSPIKTRAELGKKSCHGGCAMRLPICSFGIRSPVWGGPTRVPTAVPGWQPRLQESEGHRPLWKWSLIFPSYMGFKHRRETHSVSQGG